MIIKTFVLFSNYLLIIDINTHSLGLLSFLGRDVPPLLWKEVNEELTYTWTMCSDCFVLSSKRDVCTIALEAKEHYGRWRKESKSYRMERDAVKENWFQIWYLPFSYGHTSPYIGTQTRTRLAHLTFHHESDWPS